MLSAKHEQRNLPNNMKILFLGDISWKVGREAIAKALPDLRIKYQPDIVIANVENSAHGSGIEKRQYDYLIEAGIDYMTGGDHIFDKTGVEEIFSQNDCKLIRPANYPVKADIPGNGYIIADTKDGKLGIINLQGRIFMPESMDNPFWLAQELLEKPEFKNIPIIVDFHAEATSEKVAMGWMLDGKVAAVVGTHTHVQTNDARILPKDTAYITDVGMCGANDGVLGVNKNIIIKRFCDALPSKFESAENSMQINGIYLKIEKNKAKKIELISELID